ncbi:MAG: hypothetical protein AB1633_04625 [Elusimicrobiota bacterium]
MKKFLYVAFVSLLVPALAIAQPQEAQGTEQGNVAEKQVKQKVKKHQMTGEVVQIDAATSQFTLKNKKGESRTFSLSPKFKVKRDGKEISLTDVMGGDRLFVKYKVVEGKNIATSAKFKTEQGD